MKSNTSCFFCRMGLLFLFFHLFNPLVKAQETINISGKISDSESGEPLVGVNIAIKDKLTGTITDSKGKFFLSTKTPLPFKLIISSIGYKTEELDIKENNAEIILSLQQQAILGQDIVIAGSRVEEKVLEASVSIEKLDLLAIRESPSANFYDGLSRIKGVDMSVQSLTFANPNTRGFNGNTNYRLNQIIDGVDNVAPGLSFAAGNIVGISQLDLESVELLVGASSALYGPGGMNGTLLLTSKNPFDYQGLSMILQGGAMHLGADYRDNPAGMYDVSIRYAKAFNNRFAFKLNFSQINAIDWHASDWRDRNNLSNPNSTPVNNPGYDGVNVYGDESLFPVNLGLLAPEVGRGFALSQGFSEGTPEFENAVNTIIGLFPSNQLVTRTGYREVDFADYNTRSLKTNLSLHYRINDNLEAIVQGSYGAGTSIYTATNRFSLVDFNLWNLKAELKSKDFFVRVFTVQENAGDSFDMGGLALRFNEAWKPSEVWYEDYIEAFTASRILGNSLETSYAFARSTADNRTSNGNIIIAGQPARPLPGSPEFNTLFNQLKSIPVRDGGALVIDKSKLHQLEGMYNLSRFFNNLEVLVGASYRVYRINSEGTIFSDTPGNPIRINQFGLYAQISKKLLGNKLKFTGSGRYDKNEYFDGRLTPRLSLVYTLDNKNYHFLRVSVQTAFRFPAIPDQFTDLDVGVFRAIGGLPQFQQKYNFNEEPVYPLDNPNPLVGKADFSNGPFQFPEFRPERVTAYEIGYKGLANPNLLIDAYIYFNKYNGFIATQNLVQNPNEDGTGGNKFQMPISLEQPVNAYGWAISADYRFSRGYHVGGNIAYNTLGFNSLPAGFQTNFNSPDYRLNLFISNRNVWKNIGFSLNWRWQNKFVWESTFGVGEVPAFATLDAQASYKFTKLKSILKIGGANLLNQYYTTGFGNPQIGGLYYISLTFDQLLN